MIYLGVCSCSRQHKGQIGSITYSARQPSGSFPADYSGYSGDAHPRQTSQWDSIVCFIVLDNNSISYIFYITLCIMLCISSVYPIIYCIFIQRISLRYISLTWFSSRWEGKQKMKKEKEENGRSDMIGKERDERNTLQVNMMSWS